VKAKQDEVPRSLIDARGTREIAYLFQRLISRRSVNVTVASRSQRKSEFNPVGIPSTEQGKWVPSC